MKLLFLLSLIVLTEGVYTPPSVNTIHVSNGWNPPDQGIAVGESRVVSCVNGECILFSKTLGKPLASSSLNTFFGSVRVGSVFDPRAFFDHHSVRFVVFSTSGIRTAGSGVAFAVSKSETPETLTNSDWDFYFIRASDSNAMWADYPSVGFDQYNYYVSVNMYTGTGQEGEVDIAPRFWVISKKSLTNGESFVAKVHKTPGRYTLTPATDYNNINDHFYLVHRAGPAVNLFKVTGIQDASTSKVEEIRIMNAGSVYQAEYPPQKSSPSKINSGDTRLQFAVTSNDYIWFVHSATLQFKTTGSVLWFKIDPVSREIVNRGSFSHPDPGGGMFYPTMIPDANGNMNFGCNGVSDKEHISVYIGAVCLNGTVVGPYKATESSSTYSAGRYGDYSGVSRDPLNPSHVWSAFEVSENNRWAIRSVVHKSLCEQGRPVPQECSFDCGEHGSCDIVSGSCKCESGWDGPDCGECAEKYFGPECEQCVYCNDDKYYEAWNHGRCDSGLSGSGECICNSVWYGENCQYCPEGYYNFFDRACRICPNCRNGGKCDPNSGKCVCPLGFTGTLCESCSPGYFPPGCTPCPDCGDHGDCVNGVCVCDPNWMGANCSECIPDHYPPNCEVCPNCGDHGKCIEGVCVCEPNWTGVVCDHCNPEETDCGICNCGDHGKCIDEETGKCECEVGWALPNCSSCESGYYIYNDKCVVCPDCGDHGTCVGGECVCDPGWVTPTESHYIHQFRDNTRVTMQLADGYCSVCKNGYYFDGYDCEICPDCGGHGACNEKGRCICDPNWDGANCETCETGYYGPVCVTCPDCGIHGVCNDTISGDGRCICDPNWSGVFCGECSPGHYPPNCDPCPDCGESQSRGSCVDGSCLCEFPWTGTRCTECVKGHFGSNCENCKNCQHGICEDSKCNCKTGWSGSRCEICENDSACLHGICRDSVCVCESGWEGSTCSTCSPGNDHPECFDCFNPTQTESCQCSGNGICLVGKNKKGVCDCNDGWESIDCSVCSEGNDSPDCNWLDCGKNGKNIAPNICECQAGFKGRRCEVCEETIVNRDC